MFSDPSDCLSEVIGCNLTVQKFRQDSAGTLIIVALTCGTILCTSYLVRLADINHLGGIGVGMVQMTSSSCLFGCFVCCEDENLLRTINASFTVLHTRVQQTIVINENILTIALIDWRQGKAAAIQRCCHFVVVVIDQ